MKKVRILFGITHKFHFELGLDEMTGLQELGYECEQFEYGGRSGSESFFNRIYVVLHNVMKLLIKTYRFRPDFIYLNSRLEYKAAIRDFITILFMRLFYFRRINFLIKSHGSDLEVLETKNLFYAKIVLPFLKKQVRGWLFLSNEELAWVTSRKLMEKKKVFITKNIVRMEKFETVDIDFRNKYKIPAKTKIILFIARLIEEKGISFVIEAFSEIHRRYDTILLIIGDGPECNKVNDRIDELELRQSIIMTGWVDESMAAYFTSNSDLLLLPTFANEGFSMVIFNSLAAGLPIITTRIRAAKDYLSEPENCIWVEPRSASSITFAIRKLLDDGLGMLKMRENNKRKAIFFTRNTVTKDLSEIIKQCNV